MPVMKAFPLWQTNVSYLLCTALLCKFFCLFFVMESVPLTHFVDKLLAADERCRARVRRSAVVVYPLCLAVSDGGELWRGGCSVSVRGRSLHTLFRSTHAYAGECSAFPLKCLWPSHRVFLLLSTCLSLPADLFSALRLLFFYTII